MKKTVHLLLLAIMMATAHFALGQNFPANSPAAINGQLSVNSSTRKLVNQYGNAIQLRGMSTHGIQWYSQCLTDASLDALANDWGADILRISMYVQEGGYETNPAGFTAQVNTLIEKATARGMYALVDFHQLTPGNPNANLNNARTFFTAIANAHKNKTNILYDICNEPNGDNTTWNEIYNYADNIIPMIRAIDGDAPIIVGTQGWGSFGVSGGGGNYQTIANKLLPYPNVMYSFHFYAKSHQSQYLNALKAGAALFPVFITEFGTQEASGDGANDFAMSQSYLDYLAAEKISWCNWNYSDDNRSGAVWLPGTCSNGPWTTARLKPAGQWIRDRMRTPDDFPTNGNTNKPPVVSLTSPANGAIFTGPVNITISANASDPDAGGSVSKVEFFRGATLIGTDNTSPYSVTWSNVTEGTYTITAKATDDKNATTTSSAVSIRVENAPPTQSPYQGIFATIPGTIQAERYDVGGQGVAYSDATTANEGGAFRTDAVDIELVSGSNYNIGWLQANEWTEYTVNVTAGTYKIEARVAATATGKSFRIELDGAPIATIAVPNTNGWQTWQTVTSANVTVTGGQKILRVFAVTNDFNLDQLTFVSTTTQNEAPSVNLTSPANNATFTAPATINLAANAADEDGTISKVEFFHGTTLLASDNTSPYAYSWTGMAAGNYSITAKATDNSGAMTTSSIVNVTVTGVVPTGPVVLYQNCNNDPGYTIALPIGNYNTADLIARGIQDNDISRIDVQSGYKVTLYNSNNLDASAGSQTATTNVGCLTSVSFNDLTSSIKVELVTTTPNQAPTVSLSAPTNNANYNAPASVTVSANASDADGNNTIAQVQFFSGATLLFADVTAPYSYTWTNVAAGTYTITARVTDNAGASTASEAITVKVNTVITNGCSGIALYSGSVQYLSGATVQNDGSKYQCRPWPNSGWCTGNSWAYAPGTGAYWTDAWTLVGSCNARSEVAEAMATVNDQLLSNSPNPFSGSTTLQVYLAEASEVSIKVYDQAGQLMSTVTESNLSAGTHGIEYDASSLTPGIYMVKCYTNNGVITRKIMKAQ